MNALDTITIAAIICFILSFFTRKNAIRVSLVIGVFIAGGWALDDLTSGSLINWIITKEILVFAVLAGAAWEFASWILRMTDNNTTTH